MWVSTSSYDSVLNNVLRAVTDSDDTVVKADSAAGVLEGWIFRLDRDRDLA